MTVSQCVPLYCQWLQKSLIRVSKESTGDNRLSEEMPVQGALLPSSLGDLPSFVIISQRRRKLFQDQNTGKILPELLQSSNYPVYPSLRRRLLNLRQTRQSPKDWHEIWQFKRFTGVYSHWKPLRFAAWGLQLLIQGVSELRSQSSPNGPNQQHDQKELSSIKYRNVLFSLAWLMPFKNCKCFDMSTVANSAFN